ncbi:DUF3040 domain-containing protein [Gordonia sp. ABSL1-1]|uniref:DUF3040 domain-containing protein n=1 Tax=Gordonia sp. ABSL1-1 TaxID=3053923 RepID=UPI0025748FA5|nr:DUF3040 domain-containing protein [Gordonia sp. ABSL1-1]MDL9937396.1 DUF3040 domain-containing protein [Gordonia sp. ABSL1-1]
MPLSEHEQRMLEQIENALYAEDPKFASSVKRRRLGHSSGRRRLQAVAVFVVGLVLLVGGLIIDVTIGGFPIVSLIGFIIMFGAGLLALWGGGSSASGPTGDRTRRGGSKASGGPKRKLSERMEERFNRRFEQE